MHENHYKQLLFSHMEYIGDDFAADSQAIADHPETRVKFWTSQTLNFKRSG